MNIENEFVNSMNARNSKREKERGGRERLSNN